MTTLQYDNVTNVLDDQLDQAEIVAREGTALAEQLRSSGWVARAGWRTTGEDGQHVWLLRFRRLDRAEPTIG